MANLDMLHYTIEEEDIDDELGQCLFGETICKRIYECQYWKAECVGLNAALVVDKGIDLRYIGGIYNCGDSNNPNHIMPTPFLCLTLRLLQIQPHIEVILEYVGQSYFEYLRALGAFYLRLTGSINEVGKYLSPLYQDCTQLRMMDHKKQFSVIQMNQFVDMLFKKNQVLSIELPSLL